MAKLRLTYSSHLNTSFRGRDEWEEEIEEDTDVEALLNEIMTDWLWEHVEVSVEIVEE